MLPCMTADHMAQIIKASETATAFPAMLLLLQLFQPVVMQLLFAEDDLTQWQWYRSTCHQTSTPAATHPHSNATGADEAGHHAGFEAIPGAVKRLYVPSQDDIHHSLRVQCVPTSRWVLIATYTLHCAADFITASGCI